MWIRKEMWATLPVLRTAHSCATELLSLELPLVSPRYSTSERFQTSHRFRSLAGNFVLQVGTPRYGVVYCKIYDRIFLFTVVISY